MKWTRRFECMVFGHSYRVVRVMNPGARKVTCDRCLKNWAMHDETKAFIEWDAEIEALYAPGGILDPAWFHR